MDKLDSLKMPLKAKLLKPLRDVFLINDAILTMIMLVKTGGRPRQNYRVVSNIEITNIF